MSTFSEALGTHSYQQEFKTALEAALAAGKIMLSAGDARREVQTKANPSDFVTQFDQDCQDLISGRLRKSFPDDSFLGEELPNAQEVEKNLGEERTWIVDPIDGTTSFVQGLPDCCVVICLTIQRSAVLGVIHAPFLSETFAAVLGKGSFIVSTLQAPDAMPSTPQAVKLRASSIATIRGASICVHWPSSRADDKLHALYGIVDDVLRSPARTVRSFGSCALDLCFVASGRLDGYFERGVHAWDYGAGALILTEASGALADLNGGPVDLRARGFCAAGTLALNAALIEVVKKWKYNETAL